ncbi:type II secretion system protein GspL [Roseivivax marinus]|uniref:type II secretion system protein GspL n=1 Tax=Roseivivax marinus TaxID=1379903 RepID=UPI00273DE99B|nr:type II secretion system protein GspL [Roseivivax marinus]
MPEPTAFHRLDAAGPPPSGRHVLLVPGTEAPLLDLDLPARLRGPAREDVARRQLRDRIGPDGDRVELRPFALPRARTPWTRAVIADREAVADWRRRAGPSGAACRAVLPDYLGLPAAEGMWTVAQDGDLVRVRLGPGDGFTAEDDLARLVLGRTLEADPPTAILALGGAADWLAEMARSAEIPLATTVEEAARRGLPVAETLRHGELALDLRADPRAARERMRRAVAPWRWALVAGALAAGLWAAAELVRLGALRAEIDTVRAATDAQVRDVFVPAGPILDVRVQVTRALADRQAAAGSAAARPDPVGLLHTMSEVVATIDARTEEIRFVAGEPMRLTATLGDFAAADALVAELRAAGLRADLVEARVSDGASGVRAEISVTPEGRP